MNYRDTIIHVLNQIASDKQMQNRADYWASICGEAATLLKEDELAIVRAMELQSNCGRFSTGRYKYCPECGRKVKWE